MVSLFAIRFFCINQFINPLVSSLAPSRMMRSEASCGFSFLEPTSVWPRNGFRLDDDPAVVASGRDAVREC